MERLLQNNELRQLRLAEILIQEGNWLKIDYLAKKLKCSERILKYDLKNFQDTFTDFKIESSHLGVRMSFDANTGFKNIYKDTFNSSTSFKILEILFLNDHYSADELADLLYTSSSTIYRIINETNEVIKEYGFKIETNPCKVSGQEDKIRYFYYRFIFEKYTIFTWPYDRIYKELVTDLLHFFIDHTNAKVDFAYYNLATLILSVNLIRYKKGCYINKNGSNFDLEKTLANLSISKKETKYFENQYRLEITKEFLIEIFSPVIQDGYSFNYEALIKEAQTDKLTNKRVSHLEKMLSRLSEDNKIPLINKKNLILSLYNVIYLENYDPRSRFILYDRNALFQNRVKKYFPSFYQSSLTEIINFIKITPLELNQKTMNYLLYTLFTEWENLLIELRKKIYKIRILILSNRTPSHSQMIKNFLEAEYNDYIVCHVYNDTLISKKILEKLDYDFVVANFPVPNIKNKETFYIENFPSSSDLRNLNEKMNKIYFNIFNTN